MADRYSDKRNLLELTRGMPLEKVAQEITVSGLALDSRQIRAGDLFLAMPGAAHDGRNFIEKAIANGAAAILAESEGFRAPENSSVPVYVMKDLYRYAGRIADRFFGSPSSKMKVIGVTGTNGKTTCSQLIAQILDRPPRRCGVIGTLGSGFPGSLNPGINTTPDAVEIHRLMADFFNEGADFVCMEVSSHALEQGRVEGVHFDIAVFTNLSRDHLDYHGDMEAYGAAKASLFDMPGVQSCILNQDDAFGKTMLVGLRQNTGREDKDIYSYGLTESDFQASDIQALPGGLNFRVESPFGSANVSCSLMGHFNVYNLLAIFATLVVAGEPVDKCIDAFKHLKSVPGRMEQFKSSFSFPLVVVDYAHTPDALAAALSALKEHVRNRLWCVFGCGGDRDRGKRPEMGKIAEDYADHVILTNDNPRTEDEQRILDDIMAGMKNRPIVIPDRSQAIRHAVTNADANDIVLVAGKGHEDYQQFGDRRIPYSDRTTVQQILEEAA